MFVIIPKEIQRIILSLLDKSTRISFSHTAKEYHTPTKKEFFLDYFADRALKDGNAKLFLSAVEIGYLPWSEDYTQAARSNLFDIVQYLYNKNIDMPNSNILETCIAHNRSEIFHYIYPKLPEYGVCGKSMNSMARLPSRPWLYNNIDLNMPDQSDLLTETVLSNDLMFLEEILKEGIEILWSGPDLPLEKLIKHKRYDALHLLIGSGTPPILKCDNYELDNLILKYDTLPLFIKQFNARKTTAEVLFLCAIHRNINILNYIFKEFYEIEFSFEGNTKIVQILEVMNKHNLSYGLEWEHVVGTFDIELIEYFCENHIDEGLEIGPVPVNGINLTEELLRTISKVVPYMKSKIKFYFKLLSCNEELVLNWLLRTDETAIIKVLQLKG